MSDSHRIETRTVHAGELRPRVGGAATLPIFQCTVFEHHETRSYHDILYPRLNNLPNHVALGRKLADLEGGEDAVVTSSGMAAISTALLAVLGKDSHVLVQDCLYGGTHNLLAEDFPALGIAHDAIDPDDPGSWLEKLRPSTRAIYVEAMSNPLLQVADHRAVVEFAREHGLVSLIDNTFATPVNFRPIELGFDIVLHSATKYLNGHSDLVAGAVVGSRHWLERVRHKLNHLGGSLDPHACFLLNRGLKTLVLRVRHQNQSALQIAQLLRAHPAVQQVNYPGLEDHPAHGRARELFAGFGGMLSFELAGGVVAAQRLLKAVQLPICGPSLGGVESLITIPATTSHSGMPREDRLRLGIGDGLVRFSVGIEATEDLIEDLQQALQQAQRAS